jgi:putative aldouronate transport system substrate-binding protein
MKKGKKKTPLVIVLLLTMLIAACSGNNGTKETSPSSGLSSSEPSASANNREIVEMNLFVDHPWFPFKDWSGPIPEEITKRTGIRPIITLATDEKQLPLMMAANDLPDLVFTSASSLARMSNAQTSYSWDELIKKYAPNFKIDDERIKLNSSADGHYYTIKDAFATQAELDKYPKSLGAGPGLVIRQDIMDALGNPPLNTLDDLLNVFGMVKKKYPDMVPLVFNTDQYWTKGFIFANFGVNVDGGDMPFIEQDGKLIHQFDNPNLRDAYLFINKLYREKYIIAENFSYNTEQQADQLVYTGRAFAYSKMSTTADIATANSQSKDYKFVQVVKPLSDKFHLYGAGGGWSGVFITKKNKNPEKAIKFMEFLLSEEGQRLSYWGREGIDWTWNSDGYPEFKYNNNNDAEVSKLGAQWWGRLGHSNVTEGLNQYVPGSETAKANEALGKYRTNNNLLSLVVPEPDSAEKVIQNNLISMIKTEEVKIYLAETEEAANAAFDGMLAKAKQIGLQKYVDWANAKYVELKK